MNWGKKIIFIYIVFVVGIVILVVKSINQNQDLVTQDYYQEELQYQKVIDQSSRTAQLSEPLNIQYLHNEIQVRFPKDFSNKKIEGNLKIYCPNDAKKDKQDHFILKENQDTLKISYVGIGMRKVILSWTCDGKDYFDEKKLFLN